MGKIKNTFMIYMLLCILGATLLSMLCANICQLGQSKLCEKYRAEYENSVYSTDIHFYGEAAGDIGGRLNYYTQDILSLLPPFESAVYNILGILSVVCVPVCFAACIGIAGLLFYRREIQEPLDMLDRAADNIAENDLDFRISCRKRNELGRLCASFEKMRAALQDNNMELWRQIEERKRLNTAAAHDLRTPLTVLKGQSEMLVRYAPQMSSAKVISTAEMMQRHIIRLEAYVDTMSHLQRLEDIEVDKKAVAFCDVTDQMQAAGLMVCGDKKLVFSAFPPDTDVVRLDIGIVMRVYENLLSNACRFAEHTVTVSVEAGEHFVRLTVSDDGKGFSEKELSNAGVSFRRSSGEGEHGHFGIGLAICRILCEKHGGRLELKNDGGAVVLAVFGQ